AFDLGGSNRDTATGVVLQPDGKLVLAGTADNRDFAVARLNPDGTPDPTFGPGGKRTIAFNLGGNNVDVATGVAGGPGGRAGGVAGRGAAPAGLQEQPARPGDRPAGLRREPVRLQRPRVRRRLARPRRAGVGGRRPPSTASAACFGKRGPHETARHR